VGRWRDLLDAGVTVVGSTDAPYGYGEVRSPLKAIYQAVTRIGDGGSAPRDWMLDQTLSVAEALDPPELLSTEVWLTMVGGQRISFMVCTL
jgi:predicted amidohydrolase YtcJ